MWNNQSMKMQCKSNQKPKLVKKALQVYYAIPFFYFGATMVLLLWKVM